jgi:predicted outer membrane repeat protein
MHAQARRISLSAMLPRLMHREDRMFYILFRLRCPGICLLILVLLPAATLSTPLSGVPRAAATELTAASETFGSGIEICTPPITPVELVNPTVITTCTQANLQDALEDGGHITFDCGPDPVTITVTAPLVTSATEDIVLDGKGLVTLDGQNSSRILEKPFTPDSHNDHTLGNDLTIQNMRFINGRGPAATKDRDGNARGGALTVRSPGTRLHIINSTFENNRTASITDEDNQGGAVFAANIYETVIVGSVFDNNVAGNGGAFGAIASGLIIYNSRFTNNEAADDSDGGIVRGHGGAIHLDGVTNNGNPDSNKVVDVCGSTFEGNTAVRGGGALKVTISDNKGTKATYTRSTFINNRLVSVPPTEGHGGAIYHIEDDRSGGSSEDNIEVSHSTFQGNYAYKQGGALWITVLGNGRIVNSTFTENEASERESNRVGQGGAVIISGGFIDIVNSTFANNFATFQGGALFAGKDNSERQTTLTNTIFANNTLDPTHTNPATSKWQGYQTNRVIDDGGQNIQYPQKRPVFENNDIQITENPIFANPLLEPLADNGGYTWTMALQDGSPAINQGAAGCPDIDQRGAERVGQCDIGAFEYGGEPPVIGRPQIMALSPAMVGVDANSDLTLHIYGSGFTRDSVVRWNGSDLATTFESSNHLIVVVDQQDIGSVGTADITVYDPGDGEPYETPVRTLAMVESVSTSYLPLLAR